MRHRKSYSKFSRTPAHRKAMFRNLATSLLRQGRVETTLPKAKDLRSVVEKLITKAKKGTLHARRQAYSYLYDKAVVHKLFNELSQKYKNRQGGYTRVVKTRLRVGDKAQMAIIELVEEGVSSKKKQGRGKKEKVESKQAKNKEKEPNLESKEQLEAKKDEVALKEQESSNEAESDLSQQATEEKGKDSEQA